MRLLIFGLGYSGAAVAREAGAAGWSVAATTRGDPADVPPGVRLVPFDAAGGELEGATHLLATAPPREGQDPVLARYGGAIAGRSFAWVGYLSTTGVYGDRGGGWVDEGTEPAPSSDRARRRLAAEGGWRAAAGRGPLDLIRLAGIYGPGRSAFDELRSGRARRVVRPGHAFGRIHVEDIGRGVVAAMGRPPEGVRVLNFSDDEPAASAAVIECAARLAGLAVPAGVAFEEAWAGMSEMARSFWAEDRKVGSARTQAVVGPWRYPSFREGLAAILAAETGAGNCRR